MNDISLRHVYKVYPSRDKKPSLFKKAFSKQKIEEPTDFVAVKDFNLEIKDGEFVVFVGPSGCGKSTTLRMIAGLEDISAGELYLNGKLLNNVDPMNRDMAMVFQSYALYPHLSAYDNIAFGLRIRKIKETVIDKDGNKKVVERHYTKKEIDEKVQWAADILRIKELLNRKPSEMSGGQMQRVALGRAIVRGPKVFLLDEPLSNLDAKLRTSMRSEIVKLHQRLKTTFIYVTHDQVEAMTMGNKIVVMKEGVIQQVDKPTDLFQYPVNQFVAGFIGTPQMNFFEVTIQKNKNKHRTLFYNLKDRFNGKVDGQNVEVWVAEEQKEPFKEYKEKILTKEEENRLKVTFVNGESVEFDLSKLRQIDEKYLDGEEHRVILGVRAEHILQKEDGVSLTLSVSEILGSVTHLFVHFDGEDKDYIVAVNDAVNMDSGATVKIGFDESKVHMFDIETKQSILEGKK